MKDEYKRNSLLVIIKNSFNMKNYCIFELAALAALTFASCSSDNVEDLGGNQASQQVAIGFDGYLGRSAVDTRGSESTTEAIKTDGFGVFGNYTSGSDVSYGSGLFNNQPVTYSSEGEKWTYTPVKYWPTAGHIDFLAYAPHVKGTTLNNTSCINFTVEKEVAKQKDLLWAYATKQDKSTGKVNFTFKHALAKIGYSVKSKNNYDQTTITVKSIKLVGSVDEKTDAFYTKGTIDLSKADNKANDLWTITDNTKQNFDWLSSAQVLSTEYKPENYLFVIPQDFSGTTDQLYVVVQYTVKTTTDNTEITNTVSKKITKNFLQGKTYMINLIIGLNPIEFEATVDSWTNGESIGDIEL